MFSQSTSYHWHIGTKSMGKPQTTGYEKSVMYLGHEQCCYAYSHLVCTYIGALKYWMFNIK